GDGKHARARAQIKNGARAAIACHKIEHQEAAPSRTMMAGAKGKRGFDLDGDLIGLCRAAPMLAMNDETSRPRRRQLVEGSGNPILLVNAAETCGQRGIVTRDDGNKGADFCFVGRGAKIGFDDPWALVRAAYVWGFLERCGGGRGRIKTLDN